VRRRLPTQYPAFSCHAKGKGVGFMKNYMVKMVRFLLNQNSLDDDKLYSFYSGTIKKNKLLLTMNPIFLLLTCFFLFYGCSQDQNAGATTETTNGIALFIKDSSNQPLPLAKIALFDSSFHLQSFLLYLKPSAMTVLYAHLEEASESDSFYEVVRNMEIGLSSRMLKCGLKLESLFKTSRNVLFSYDELIKEKAGFIKRKLLERRFTPKEKFHFLRHGGFSALYANYYEMIKKSGDTDSSFPIDTILVHKKTLQNQMKESFLCLFFYALINPAEKIKKFLKKRIG
jgi:hypothetical protein